jgi:ABC-type transporter Mla subunit MlaD
MTDKKSSQPGDLRAAAQAAAQAAQELASGALRVPTASAQVVAQLPGLIENLAAATERLNTNLDRLERYLALADPTFETIDRLLPQLEALAARGDQAFRAVRDIPGVGTFGRITGLASDPGTGQADSTKDGKAAKRRSEPRRRKD